MQVMQSRGKNLLKEMKKSVLSQTIVPDGMKVTVVDRLLAFNIPDDVERDEVSVWLDHLRFDETTTYPFVINVFDIDGPLFIESDDDLRSYRDLWVEQHGG